MIHTFCKECRICKNTNLIDVIDLGEQKITSRFPLYGDNSTPSTPIVLALCNVCSLVQLKHSTNSSELYEHEYGYRSGISNTMRAHLKQYQEEILTKINLTSGDVIVDIGSNDSTMLQYYPSDIKRIGVDPTGKQFKEFYGNVELIPTYFNYENFTSVYGNTKVKMVSSISMFYDLPDPVQFAKDISNILDDNGIWTCEQSYILTMINTNSIDTICHEHLEYYSLTAVKYIADLANMKIIDVKFNDCNGGSFRVYFAKKSSTLYSECTDFINNLLAEEEEKIQIRNPDIYTQFMENCDYQVKKLKTFINTIKQHGKQIQIYGASTKGNCLLQYAKLGEEYIKYAVERNLNKVGKMTSTGIEIISEETMRANPPEYLLVLPWHFREEIIQREDAYLENGGQLVFPFPNFEIYSKHKKVLITGCDGMIAKYVINEYNSFQLYGFARAMKTCSEPCIPKFYFDLTNKPELEFYLDIVKPDVIIHLAGMTSAGEAFYHPLSAININGLVIANICDIIHTKNWKTKLFNSSSSEIYKGHVKYEVNENDNNMFHCHPYSIAKIMGHSMVDFYRNTYNLPFSNGIFFTIESKHKQGNFLLSKVSKHARKWKEETEVEPLILGSLDSYRTILHASDAANAIKLIVEQDDGNNYLICGNESIKILDLVLKIYEKNGISVKYDEHKIYDVTSNKLITIIENVNKGLDTTAIHITGKRESIDKLGWIPKYSIDDIVSEIVDIQ